MMARSKRLRQCKTVRSISGVNAADAAKTAFEAVMVYSRPPITALPQVHSPLVLGSRGGFHLRRAGSDFSICTTLHDASF